MQDMIRQITDPYYHNLVSLLLGEEAKRPTCSALLNELQWLQTRPDEAHHGGSRGDVPALSVVTNCLSSSSSLRNSLSSSSSLRNSLSYEKIEAEEWCIGKRGLVRFDALGKAKEVEYCKLNLMFATEEGASSSSEAGNSSRASGASNSSEAGSANNAKKTENANNAKKTDNANNAAEAANTSISTNTANTNEVSDRQRDKE